MDSINRQRKQADESFQELQKRNGVLEELSSDLNRKLIENKDKMNSISSELNVVLMSMYLSISTH